MKEGSLGQELLLRQPSCASVWFDTFQFSKTLQKAWLASFGAACRSRRPFLSLSLHKEGRVLPLPRLDLQHPPSSCRSSNIQEPLWVWRCRCEGREGGRELCSNSRVLPLETLKCCPIYATTEARFTYICIPLNLSCVYSALSCPYALFSRFLDNKSWLQCSVEHGVQSSYEKLPFQHHQLGRPSRL